MRLAIFWIFAAAITLGGCRKPPPQTAVIYDATHEQFVSLTHVGAKPPSSLAWRITGKLDGSGTVVVLRDGRPVQTHSLAAGAIDVEWRGAWPSRQITFHYLPGSVKHGSLQVLCRFRD